MAGPSEAAMDRSGRIGTGIELRPEYAKVTLDRLEAVCETQAVRVNP